MSYSYYFLLYESNIDLMFNSHLIDIYRFAYNITSHTSIRYFKNFVKAQLMLNVKYCFKYLTLLLEATVSSAVVCRCLVLKA